MLFAEFAATYIAWTRHRLRSHRRIARIMGKWCEFFAGRTIRSIRRADIARWIAARQQTGRAPNTINVDLVILSGAFNYAIRVLEWEIRNPVSGQLLPAAEGRLRWLKPHEAARLLSEADQIHRKVHIRPFVQLALNTGCRKSELTHLKWDEVDFTHRRIMLEGDRTKNGKRRIVPLNRTALQALQDRRTFCDQYCPESPWVFCWKSGRPIKDVRRGVNTALRRAGIQDFHVHDLRHTFASWLVQNDVELMKVRDLLGHSTIRMTERYAHLATNSLARAVAVLDSHLE